MLAERYTFIIAYTSKSNTWSYKGKYVTISSLSMMLAIDFLL